MPPTPKIGQYRHTPGGEMTPGPDGALRARRVRRRFPLWGLVAMGYGVVGPLVCAGVTRLFQVTGHARFLPQHYSEQAVPPSPTLNNLLFGAGLPELVLACSLAGLLLWRMLWNTRVAPEVEKEGALACFRLLLPQALMLGAVVALMMLPLAATGFCVRAMPPEIPGPARVLFGLLGSIPLSFTALLTGVVPLVQLALGLLLGVTTAAAIAALWQQYPQEPELG